MIEPCNGLICNAFQWQVRVASGANFRISMTEIVADKASPSQTDSPPEAPKGGLSEPAKNTLALVGGCLTGWFLGPWASVLAPLSKGLLNLLNMLSLPFVVVGLVHAIGQLPVARLSAMARAGGKALAAILAMSLAGCWAVSALFPTVGNAAFLGPVQAQAGESVDLLTQLIPANPFEALATGGVPAVVFFCLLFAWCLLRVEGREKLLAVVDVAYRVLEEMWDTISRMLPLITFCLSTTAVGLLDEALISQVRVFFVGVVVLTLFFVLAAFPALLSMTSGRPFLEVWKRCFVPMQLSFLIGSTFAVLPLVIASAADLVRDASKETDAPEASASGSASGARVVAAADGADTAREVGDDDARAAEVSTIAMLGYQFPLTGSLVLILYILFAAAAFDRYLDLGAQLRLALMGPLALFGSSTGANAFLCDMLGIPHDAVALYAGIHEMTARFESALESGSLLLLTVLTWNAVHRARGVGYVRLAALFAAMTVLLALVCGRASGALSSLPSIRHYYARHPQILSKRVTVKQGAGDPVTSTPVSGLARVNRGRPLRVGVVSTERPPFVYYNKQGELVGYSVELTGMLADALQAPIELIVLKRDDDWKKALSERRIDLILSPVVQVSERLRTLAFPAIYGTVNPVLVFRDTARSIMTQHRRDNDFSGLRVGVSRSTLKRGILSALVPGAQLVEIEGPDQLVTDATLDGMLWVDVEAAAWEITHVEFGRVTLESTPIIYGYPVRVDDFEMQAFLTDWFETLDTRGDLRHLREDWMMGRGPREVRLSPVQRLWRWLSGAAVKE